MKIENAGLLKCEIFFCEIMCRIHEYRATTVQSMKADDNFKLILVTRLLVINAKNPSTKLSPRNGQAPKSRVSQGLFKNQCNLKGLVIK